MTTFRYKAISQTGDTVRGNMDAASVEEVIAKLQDQGHTPLDASAAGAADAARSFAWLQRGPFKGDQLAMFTHQLATLLGAGQPLDRALSMLMDLPEGVRAQKLIERVRDRVRGGSTLSRALEEEHEVFPRLYISLVRAGETRGSLEGTLRRLADYLERAQALRGSVINALIYPAFLLIGVVGSLVLLMAYVVPQFVPIFADMGVPIPLMTRLVLDLGEVIQGWWWLILIVLIVGMLLGRARLRHADTREAFHAWLLSVRVVGPLLLKVETARIARTLGTLLKNGVPLLAALSIARQVTSNSALDRALAQAAEAVKGGAGLGTALAETRRFPRLALQMIDVGEEAGALDALLLKVADTFDQESRRAIDRMLAALVPVLTLVMTALVAVIMAAILMPLLSLTGSIH
jgi:general secretion pathway protein F